MISKMDKKIAPAGFEPTSTGPEPVMQGHHNNYYVF